MLIYTTEVQSKKSGTCNEFSQTHLPGKCAVPCFRKKIFLTLDLVFSNQNKRRASVNTDFYANASIEKFLNNVKLTNAKILNLEKRSLDFSGKAFN